MAHAHAELLHAREQRRRRRRSARRDADLRIEAHALRLGRSASISSTVGAPLKWVTRSRLDQPDHRPGSIARSITCVPPAAVTAHGKHQPLQWNSGSVQR
jgi:hypothetical protein